MTLATVLLLAPLLGQESPLASPQAGILAGARGELRAVRGVAGAWVLGESVAQGAISAACSETLCLAKTAGAILSAGGETPAPPGPALFAFDSERALLYFPDSRQFAWWRDGRLDLLDWRIEGAVLSLRLTTAGPEIAVRRSNAVWIVNPENATLDSLPDASGPALLLPGAILYSGGARLVLRRNNAGEAIFPLSGVVELFQAGPSYAAARTAGSTFLIRLDPHREAVFQLPEPVN
jgi:hypothetical protein